MNALLDPLLRVGRDLVRKKLWPVAALLLVAIAAVPVAIGTSSEDAPAPVPVAPAAPGAGGTKSLVTVVDQAVTGKHGRPGRIDDPFFDPPAPPAAASSGGAVPAGPATGGASSDPPAGTSPDPSADPPADPPAETPPAEPAAPAVAPVYFRTVVRWHEAAGGTPHPIARLTPFGGLADPAALYLGVTGSVRGGGATAYAMFLLGANATSDGEGECEDETNCRIVGLKAGESRIVSVQPPDGGAARRFSLAVVSVKRVKAGPAEARKMRAKVHSGGRDVLREMWQDAPTAAALRPLRYSQARGLLYTTGAEKASG